MDFNVSIYYLLALAFGRNSIPNYAPGRVNAPVEIASAKYETAIERDAEPRKRVAPYRGNVASYDFPIYEQIDFTSGSYNIGNQQYSYEGLSLPPATVVDLRKQKTIVQTPIAGRNGTVKELISSDDWNLRIRGIITPGSLDNQVLYDMNQYPYDEVRLLNELCDIPAALDVVAEIFTALKINSIAILSLELPRLEGYPSIQPYIIEAISDQAIELKIIDN